MGRPRLQIDADLVGQLAYEGCSDQEIADIVGAARSTIANRFRQILTQKRAERKRDLRKMQWNTARENPTMQIWLGKNELGQTDKVTPDVTVLKVEYADRPIDDHAPEAAPGPEENPG